LVFGAIKFYCTDTLEQYTKLSVIRIVADVRNSRIVLATNTRKKNKQSRQFRPQKPQQLFFLRQFHKILGNKNLVCKPVQFAEGCRYAAKDTISTSRRASRAVIARFSNSCAVLFSIHSSPHYRLHSER